MKIFRKIIGSICALYPLGMMALVAHTSWTPLNENMALALGYLSFCGAIFLLSPLLDD